MKESILEDYKKNKKTYHAYRERIINLLNDLLSTEQIIVHQLVGRTKSLESLNKKIDEKNDKYKSIEEVTDIIGIRIITYLESDINPIAELIEKEFIKDEANSVDKRKLQADRFGYKSLHVVVSLNNSRTKLKEYKKYKDFKFEIQIRSILQHAWAEIEHDLGYKGEISIPDEYKRSFNRLSALLETADIDFNRLKTELKEYEKDVPDLIKSKAEAVDINSTSIKSFLETNMVLKESSDTIEKAIGSKMENSDNFDRIIKIFQYLKFRTIGDIEKALEINKIHYINFVKVFVEKFLKKRDWAPVQSAPLLFFIHFWIGKSEDVDLKKGYVEKFYNDSDHSTGQRFVDRYSEIYKQTLE
ncbi:MAG: GTP pyrophosphokinase [Janthinobacterium lividum]